MNWHRRFNDWCEEHIGPCYPYPAYQVELPLILLAFVGLIFLGLGLGWFGDTTVAC